MTRRASTDRRPDDDPVVRYRCGIEPGDRAELVDALAELLIDVVERRQARATAGVAGDVHDPAAPRETLQTIIEHMEGDAA